MLGSDLIDWSHNGFVLSAAQRQFYEKNGYLVVPNCVSRGEIDRYAERFKEVCANPAGRNPKMMMLRDVTLANSGDFKASEDNVTKIFSWQDDPVLSGYYRNEANYRTTHQIVNVLRDLIGTQSCQNFVAMHTMLINKPPDTGSLTSRHPMHQDLYFFPFRPAEFITCAWTAMEKMSRSNGCLIVVPGSHKGPLLPHKEPEWEKVNKAYHGIVNFDPDMPRTYLEMEAGDTVFFHPLIIHGSGANRTTGYRKAISCHYANDDMCSYVNIDDFMSAEIKEDVLSMARVILRKNPKSYKLVADKMEVADLWKVRARAVNGTKSNL